MMVQQDHDSTHDRFHTQNIDIKKIHSHGNVDVSLQNLNAFADDMVTLYQAYFGNYCQQFTIHKNEEYIFTATQFAKANDFKEGTCNGHGFNISKGTSHIDIHEIGTVKREDWGNGKPLLDLETVFHPENDVTLY